MHVQLMFGDFRHDDFLHDEQTIQQAKVKLTCLTECPTDNESLVSPTSMPMSKQRLSMFQERLYTMTWSSCRSRIS